MGEPRVAIEVLQKHGTTNPNDISAIGYCFGGGVVLHMARFGMDLDGVVSFHGNLATKTPAKRGTVKAKLLVLHGADDPLVPPEQVAAFKREMDAAEVDYTFIAYPGAKHAFTDEAATDKGKKFNMPLEYNEQADLESWEEMIKFFAALYPAPGPTSRTRIISWSSCDRMWQCQTYRPGLSKVGLIRVIWSGNAVTMSLGAFSTYSSISRTALP